MLISKIIDSIRCYIPQFDAKAMNTTHCLMRLRWLRPRLTPLPSQVSRTNSLHHRRRLRPRKMFRTTKASQREFTPAPFLARQFDCQGGFEVQLLIILSQPNVLGRSVDIVGTE
ncbi:hypothetical protein ABVK25_011631 [Lepraria finkii]|uniref:Uncharacterized protein n=1 Tax=Lepraria finkii TaxID=1340010 RepID=A0ABR4AMD2_9LECA